MMRALGYSPCITRRVSQGYTKNMLTGPEDPRHGSLTAYNHHRCRCAACVRVHREANRRQRLERLEKGLAPDDPRHGTDNAYSNWKCRCGPCRAAHSDVLKHYKHRGYRKVGVWTINDIIPDDLKVTQEVT